ncbi:MAG: hypothetical protein ABSG01_10010 [Anaerolineales bacterium]|jgi:hypothetical protein
MTKSDNKNTTPAPRANTPETGRDHHGRWLPGQSGNMNGRPPDGASWSGVIRSLSDMSCEELADQVGPTSELGKELLKHPHGTPLKKLIIAKTLNNLLKEPHAGLLAELLNRSEGRTPLRMEVNSYDQLTQEQIQDRITQIMNSARDRLVASEKEDDESGQ